MLKLPAATFTSLDEADCVCVCGGGDHSFLSLCWIQGVWAEYHGHLFPFINVSHSGLLWALRMDIWTLNSKGGGGLAVCEDRES